MLAILLTSIRQVYLNPKGPHLIFPIKLSYRQILIN